MKKIHPVNWIVLIVFISIIIVYISAGEIPAPEPLIVFGSLFALLQYSQRKTKSIEHSIDNSKIVNCETLYIEYIFPVFGMILVVDFEGRKKQIERLNFSQTFYVFYRLPRLLLELGIPFLKRKILKNNHINLYYSKEDDKLFFDRHINSEFLRLKK